MSILRESWVLKARHIMCESFIVVIITGAKVADFDAHALNVSVEELGRENSNFGWIVEVI